MNMLSMQDTVIVATHKEFLKDISSRPKICSNKDFLLKIVCY